MEEIKNKRITKENIRQIAKLLYERFESLNENFCQYKSESEDYKSSKNDVIKDIVVSSKPTLTFDITMKNETESTSDINSFIDYMMNYSKQIEKLSISYYAYYHTNASNNSAYNGIHSQEDFHITFRPDSIYYSSSFENPSREFMDLLNEIKNIISRAPVRYDDTIKKKNSRENFPSLTIGLLMGFFLTIGLFLFCKFSGIDIYINNFVQTPYFAPVMLVAFLLIGLIIPGKNHPLYRQIKIKQRYVGYNSSTREDMYENDIRDFTSQCEVEIGEFSNYGEIRNKIEINYKKAKKLFWIELAVFAVLCIILIFI